MSNNKNQNLQFFRKLVIIQSQKKEKNLKKNLNSIIQKQKIKEDSNMNKFSFFNNFLSCTKEKRNNFPKV